MHKFVTEIQEQLSKFKLDKINLMEVCGTHTMAIARSGIKTILPDNINLLSGPGCPVCVTDQQTIDYAIELAQQSDILITTFGDMVRVPGSKASLEQFKPRIVYSALDALKVAEHNPGKDVVFIGVGFETTSPTIAATVLRAKQTKIKNFYVLPSFKLIPPALEFIARAPEINVDGFILPGHVSAIIGSEPYKFLVDKYHLPGCITGFEPVDILQGILNLAKQIVEKKAYINIEYKRVVKPRGNQAAKKILETVFTVCDAPWRGIGIIKSSGLTFNKAFEQFDIRPKYQIKIPHYHPPKGCICGNVLLGINSPGDCKLFGNRCTPLSPVGPCMVSSEGSCAAYYKYGRPKTKAHK